MKKVLICDDCSEHAIFVMGVLQSHHHDVQYAFIRARALELVRDWRPNVIIFASGFSDEPTAAAWKFFSDVLRENPTPRPYLVAFEIQDSRRERALCAECGANEYVVLGQTNLKSVLEWTEHAHG